MRFGRQLVVLVVASLAATVLAVVGPVAAASADSPSDELRPWNLSTVPKCLDLRTQDGVNSPHARFQLWSCSGALEQQFRSRPYYHLYGSRWLYQIVNLRSGMCMEVRDGRTTAEAQIDQFPCATSGAVDGVTSRQLWLVTRFNGRSLYQLQPWSNTAMCLDVKGSENGNGVKIQQYPCNNTRAQMWGGNALVDDGYVVW